jgi:trans-o-hydroxybenzylidenepyruvate hydratase-aldolase
MASKARLTAEDIKGAWVILPTPAKENVADWDAASTVNLDETVRMVDALIEAGVDGLLSLGTFGEAATLSWDEKRDFIAAVVETVRGRVPYFCGTTALSTREVVRQTRVAYGIGASGTMLGVPMWCAPDLRVAVEFYRAVAEACPGMAICIYANAEAFKFSFPRPFWAEIGKIPQVVCSKYLNIAQLLTDLSLAPTIRFLPHEGDYYAAARMAPERCTAFWSSGGLCGPATPLRLRDEIAKAKHTGDWAAARAVADNIRRADAGFLPKGEFSEFSKYNIALEKERMNSARWLNAGPVRPPYHVVPEEYLEAARRSGRSWAELHKRYGADH